TPASAVAPRVDPAGRPWHLTGDATAPAPRRIADKTAAAPDGHWTRHGLASGTYRIALEDSDGKQWLQRFVELAAGGGPLSLRLGFVGVAGRVHLSRQPLRARLV